MQYLKIDDDLRFALEQNAKELRVMVTRGSNELACHKVTLKIFETFLKTNNAHLFKGRLQLDNHNGVVTLNLKGTEIGALNAADITAMLQTVAA